MHACIHTVNACKKERQRRENTFIFSTILLPYLGKNKKAIINRLKEEICECIFRIISYKKECVHT